MCPNGLSGNLQVESLTVANRVFTNLSNLKLLSGAIETANTRSTARLQTATSGYAATGTNGFRVKAIRLKVSIAEAATLVSLFYSDNDCGMNGTTAATNQVYLGGSVKAAAVVGDVVAVGSIEHPVDFLIPNGKFVGVEKDGSTGRIQFTLFGYET